MGQLNEFPLAIGFIGAGQMATALALGWARAGLLDSARSIAVDPSPDARLQFEAKTHVRVIEDTAEVAARSQILILAVKPQVMKLALTELKSHLRANHLVISIAAGFKIAQLASALGSEPQIVRVMPNTPCLVGESASAYSVGPGVDDKNASLVAKLFNAVGKAHALPEPLLDAVTGLSGSGPAYIYLIIEALADGGVAAGLPRITAQALAAQTVLGAAKMVLETGLHPGSLKDAVASPGGTTIAGLHALEKGAVRAAFMNAVVAATERSKELGQPS